MDYKTAAKTLLEIEQQFDVNTLRYKNLVVWPLVRRGLWEQLLALGPNKVGRVEQPSGNQRSVVKRFSRFASTFWPLWCKAKYRQEYQTQYAVLEKVKYPDILFLLKGEHSRVQIKNKYYNHYIEPWVEFAQERYKCASIEIDSAEGRRAMPRLTPPLFIAPDCHFVIEELKDQLRSSSNRLGAGRNHIEGFAEFSQIAYQMTAGLDLQEQTFVYQAQVLQRYERFYDHILSYMKPKAAFLVNYFSVNSMAFVLSCRKHDIKVVDIQHGTQGKYHAFYTHWTRITRYGYDLLPDYFWVWGEEARRNINQWVPSHCQRHRALVGGNLWLLKWKSNDNWHVETCEEAHYYQCFVQWDKVILFSAQVMAQPIPDLLLSAMQKAPDKWLWLIRLHPSQRSEISRVERYLEGKGVRHFEIRQATELPLYGLLKRCDHHITCWSTVCYEALAFGLATSIIHANGRDLYQEYIDTGYFSYAESWEKLLEQVREEYPNNFVNENEPYIIADVSAAEKAFETILRAK